MNFFIKSDAGPFTYRPPDGTKEFRWWAEYGFIFAEDTTTGKTQTFNYRDLAVNCDRVNKMLGNRRTGQGIHSYHALVAERDFLDRVIGLCKAAKAQGDAYDRGIIRVSQDKPDMSKKDRDKKIIVALS